MSTEYRKADCQSTKNVGGDKGVDPQSGPSGVSLGFKVEPEHAYLGHFKQEKVLRDGHNFGPRFTTSNGQIVRQRGGTTTTMGAAAGGAAINALSRRAAAANIRAGSQVVANERPVLAAKLAAKAAGVTGVDRRALLSEARAMPGSRASEMARRQAARKVY